MCGVPGAACMVGAFFYEFSIALPSGRYVFWFFAVFFIPFILQGFSGRNLLF